MTPLFIAVALGDYTTVVLDESFEPTLQVLRSSTMRCLKYHPTLPFLAMGDGAGTVAIVNYEDQEVVHELEIGGRVNVVDFSPIGDYLVVGTDDCHFTIHETLEYRRAQEVLCEGFALSAGFSPDGLHLAIGSATESAMVRLGPFLAIDLVPMPWKGVAEKVCHLGLGVKFYIEAAMVHPLFSVSWGKGAQTFCNKLLLFFKSTPTLRTPSTGKQDTAASTQH